MLWADIDNPPSGALDGVVRALKQSTPFLIYTTKSATFEAQKCRILMPLLQTVDFETWLYCQGKLNKTLLNSAGIKADPCNLNPSQILFLPNKGAYYNHNHRVGFLKEKTRAVAIHHPTMAEVKPIQPRSTPPGGSVIDRFNVAYSVADILRQAGYSQCPYDPLKWRHPNSESGSYSATINPKTGRVHSLSSADPLYTGGGGVGAHDAFGAFCVLLCDGDMRLAVYKAANEMLEVCHG